jgi:CBS domain-containing protein
VKVTEVLEREPLVATMTDSAASAWDRMQRSGADHLVVLDAKQRVVGTVSRDDRGGPAGGRHRRMGRTVGQLMHREPVTVTPGTSVRRAAALMRERHTGCLPVMRGQKLVGLVTVGTLLSLLEHANP